MAATEILQYGPRFRIREEEEEEEEERLLACLMQGGQNEPLFLCLPQAQTKKRQFSFS